jgi:hypothetical protein
MREPAAIWPTPMSFAPRIEFPITTADRWDGVGIYQGDVCVLLQNFDVSRYVYNGDTLIVDISSIYNIVAATADANRLRGMTVRLHRYDEPARFDLPEVPEIEFRRDEPIDLCYKRQKTDWLAEGF